MSNETKGPQPPAEAQAVVGLAARAVPFLRDEGEKYEDDGSNEPLELAREIESALASLPPVESALPSANSAFDGGREATPQPLAEAQAVGGGEEGFKAWVVEQMPAGTVIGNPAWWADRLARAYAFNVPAPPSAPVGVEALVALAEEWKRPAYYSEFDARDCAKELEAALAQQPATSPEGMVLVPLDAITSAATELSFAGRENAAADLLNFMLAAQQEGAP